jgi:hypothetical protein
MMNAVTVKVNEDPSKLFEQVSAIQNRYDTVTHMIDEEELIAVAVGTVLDSNTDKPSTVLGSVQFDGYAANH